MKKIQEFLPYYLGCECQFSNGENSIAKSMCLDFYGAGTLAVQNKYGGWWNAKLVKPILRRLESMTEEEKKTALHIGNRELDSWIGGANRTAYLLKQGFDLFGLIDSGLAIDRETYKSK